MMKRLNVATSRLARRAAAMVLTAVVVAAPCAARAEVAAADPIDASMRACLARADRSSTAGQVQCMETARLAWHAAIDLAYQQLQAKATPALRTGWQKSQRTWQASREADGELLAAVIATTHGTRYQLSEADMQLQPVRDRALMLRSAVADAGDTDPRTRLRACSAEPECAHAVADLNRYERRLRNKLPQRARLTLTRAERAWLVYRDATTPLTGESGRLDILGARVATLKRLGDTAGND
jgi:uncharacterized protein YecT (DUF1311 family)